VNKVDGAGAKLGLFGRRVGGAQILWASKGMALLLAIHPCLEGSAVDNQGEWEGHMKVFISWSGDYSKQLAAAIHWWVPKVLSQVDVYFSDIDIEVGSRWYHSIVDNLEKSDAGLVILTPENITRQWIMFEAGAMARSVTQARVCPILFGITKSEWNLKGGPLSFFQAVEFTEQEKRAGSRELSWGRPERRRRRAPAIVR
jgi:hypothetical protein